MSRETQNTTFQRDRDSRANVTEEPQCRGHVEIVCVVHLLELTDAKYPGTYCATIKSAHGIWLLLRGAIRYPYAMVSSLIAVSAHCDRF